MKTAEGNGMNCPKCGTLIPDPEWRDELRLNRLILVAATVMIVIVMIVATIVVVGASRPRPELIGDLDVHHFSSDGTDGNYTIQLSGHVYNVGPVGCFANVTCILTDHRGWSYENSYNIGWIPIDEVWSVSDLIEYPVLFDGVEVRIPDLTKFHVELEFEFYDPTYDNRSS